MCQQTLRMKVEGINMNNDDSIHLRSLTSIDQQQDLCSVGRNYTDCAGLHGGNLEVDVAYFKTAPCICFTNSRQVTVSRGLVSCYKLMYIVGPDIVLQTKICCYKHSHTTQASMEAMLQLPRTCLEGIWRREGISPCILNLRP
jgi:hypothetical protein